MKTILKYMLFCLPILAAGCSDDDLRFSIDTPEDTMHIAATPDDVVLKHNLKNQTAVTFTWGDAAQREGVESMKYYFKMDIAENDFATSIPKVEIVGNSISYSHYELNQMLGSWGVAPGETAMVEAEIIAQPEGTEKYMKPEVSKVTFNVKSYSVSLFLAGTATSVGDDPTHALQLTEVTAASKYTWTGMLRKGTLYFPTSRDTKEGSYGAGADGTIQYYDGEPMPIEITHDGFYTVDVDIDALSIAYSERVFMVGDATPNGWTIEKSTELEQQGTSRIYKWKGLLNKGEIKFPLQPETADWNGPFLLAEKNGVVANGTSKFNFVEHCADSIDFKWKVPEAALYEITVNLDNQTVTFDKEELDLPYTDIWMCGDATPGGWNSTPFPIKLSYDYTAKKGTFVWEGELIAGELKFPLHESGFEGDYLMAPYANAPLTESTMVYSKDGNPDNKWVVKSTEEGKYRVSINVFDMTVTFTKLD